MIIIPYYTEMESNEDGFFYGMRMSLCKNKTMNLDEIKQFAERKRVRCIKIFT